MYQEPQDDYYIRKEEEREERLDRLRMTAGLMEFFGVVLGVIAIFVLVVLIVSLCNWLYRDMESIFSVVFSIFKS
ncbi:MAG: hypothetical protein IKM26_06095 [Clostridia bacterium]|nr:hypothetical protein [Clostridia bacterium]MBR6787472.1 hypothetical protein [Clostridia bacterium]